MRYKRISEISSSSNGGLPCSRQNSLSTFLKAWELSSLVQKTRYTEEKFIEVSLNSTHSPPLSFSLIRMCTDQEKLAENRSQEVEKLTQQSLLRYIKLVYRSQQKRNAVINTSGFQFWNLKDCTPEGRWILKRRRPAHLPPSMPKTETQSGNSSTLMNYVDKCKASSIFHGQ